MLSHVVISLCFKSLPMYAWVHSEENLVVVTSNMFLKYVANLLDQHFRIKEKTSNLVLVQI